MTLCYDFCVIYRKVNERSNSSSTVPTDQPEDPSNDPPVDPLYDPWDGPLDDAGSHRNVNPYVSSPISINSPKVMSIYSWYIYKLLWHVIIMMQSVVELGDDDQDPVLAVAIHLSKEQKQPIAADGP